MRMPAEDYIWRPATTPQVTWILRPRCSVPKFPHMTGLADNECAERSTTKCITSQETIFYLPVKVGSFM